MANIKKYQKGDRTKLTANFSVVEFDCSCSQCTETIIDLDHVAKLQQLREDLGSPIKITSAYRCESHNTAVGGVKNSQHTKGTATDIQVSGMTPSEVQDACDHFDGVGRYDSFTHIDSRGNSARWDKRSKEDYLPSGPSVDDIDISLEDIERD